MSSIWGNALKLSIFGESHGPAIGMVLDGLPAGEKIDEKELMLQTARRAPGLMDGATPRVEKDKPVFQSGILNGVLTGAPLCALIENTNTKSSDYNNISSCPRPSHADYTGKVRYGGFNDIRGGGHFSGRLTAPIVIAGSVCRQILERRGIYIGSHISNIGNVNDEPFDPVNIDTDELKRLSRTQFAVRSEEAKEKMQEKIKKIQAEQDSVGGIIECAAAGLPAGIGSPMFDGLESRLASLLYGIPAVKGVDFGAGFSLGYMTGSQANDEMYYNENGEIKMKTNNNGGILGGISTGMPLVFQVCVKPTPSIGKKQNTVNLETQENDELTIHGRHDACIALRAQPVVEAAACIAILDAILSQ